MILLCQRILETKRISHLYGSALFTIPLNQNFLQAKNPVSRCTRKETIDIYILKISRNRDIKIMQPIEIKSETPTRIRKWNQFRQFRCISTKAPPIFCQLVKGLKEGAEQHQHPTYTFLQLIQHVQVEVRITSTDVKTGFHTWLDDKLYKIHKDKTSVEETSCNESKLQFS